MVLFCDWRVKQDGNLREMEYYSHMDMVQWARNVKWDMGLKDVAEGHLRQYGIELIQNSRRSDDSAVWMMYT